MTRRVLHVVGSMERGGIQTWLMHLLRNIGRQRYQMDFMINSDLDGAYDGEILQLGSKLLRCSNPRNPWHYARDFARALRAEERYDVIHSHVYSFSGFVLRLAARQGIPMRIAHVHNDRRVVEAQRGMIRQSQLQLMKTWIRRLERSAT